MVILRAMRAIRALARRLRFTFGLQPARNISARMSRYVRSAESPTLTVATLNVAGDMAAEDWTLAGLHCPLPRTYNLLRTSSSCFGGEMA